MAGNTQFLNKLSGSIRRVSYSRSYRYPYSSLLMFEKPLSVKLYGSLTFSWHWNLTIWKHFLISLLSLKMFIKTRTTEDSGKLTDSWLCNQSSKCSAFYSLGFCPSHQLPKGSRICRFLKFQLKFAVASLMYIFQQHMNPVIECKSFRYWTSSNKCPVLKFANWCRYLQFHALFFSSSNITVPKVLEKLIN